MPKFLKFAQVITMLFCVACSAGIDKSREAEFSLSADPDSIAHSDITGTSSGLNASYNTSATHSSLTKSSSIIDFNTGISTIEIILLPKKPLIGKIKDILKHQDQTFVVDDIYSNIKVYDKNLNFIREIGTKGTGPGEYMGISQAFIKNDLLHIFSYFNKSIFIYETDGEYVRQVKLEDHPETILPLGDNFLGYMDFGSGNSKKPNLILFSAKGKIMEMDLLDHTMAQRIGFVGGISKDVNSNDFYYHESFSKMLTKWNPQFNMVQTFDANFFEYPYEGNYQNVNINAAEAFQYFLRFNNSFNDKIFFTYYDRKNLREGFADLANGLIYSEDQIKPLHLPLFISNVRFKDQDNYFYALPQLEKLYMMKDFIDFSFPKMPDSFGSKLKSMALEEDDKFFIRFKMK